MWCSLYCLEVMKLQSSMREVPAIAAGPAAGEIKNP
jgi:hypothetical protein